MGKIVSSVLKPVTSIIGGLTGANEARDAANLASAQTREAAQAAAAAAAFRPVGMTTRFGTSQFTRDVDPRTGIPYVSSAGYTPAPEIAALQNRLFSQFVPSLATAERVAQAYEPLLGSAGRAFSLGEQYLATSPEQAAQQYMTAQRNLLASPREQQLSGIRNRLFATGRGGLATGGTRAGQAAANPELQAYYNALAQQDLQLAAQAEQEGRNRSLFGTQMLGTGGSLLGAYSTGQGTAYSPFQNILGLSGQVEQFAQQPLQLGLQIGSAALPGQTAGAQMYGSGMANAANIQAQGAMQAAQMNSAFLNNLIGSAASAYGMSKIGGGVTGLTGGMGSLGSLNWTSPLSGAIGQFGQGFGLSAMPSTSAFGSLSPAMSSLSFR